MNVPLIPESAPFSAEQRAWLNGFFAGVFSRGPASGSSLSTQPSTALTPLTILFGSQTGTAESLAKRAAKEAGKRHFAPTVVDMAQFDLNRLTTEKNVLIITSTYGDGEPPDNAKALWTALRAGTANLASVKFSVCGLGDTNYTQFCQCAKDFDACLEKHGATRVAPRAECDLDYEAPFTRWLNEALTAFGTNSGSETVPAVPPSNAATPKIESADTAAAYSRSNPFPALLLTSRTLNGAGSSKEVRHVEFSLEGSGLAYEAGDALGVYAHNCPEAVNEVLASLGCDGEEAVTVPDGSTTSLRHALTSHYDLGKPSPELLQVYAGHARSGNVAVAESLLHVIDVLLANSDVKLSPANLVAALKKLQPRLYSISSSPKAHRESVHLTVGAVRYEASGRKRKGVCSTFLADRVIPGETRVGVFVHSNRAFRPPANGDTPMIMVGPGTGIAPFRGFLHERRATGAKGRNWLFFGDQRASSDFLYREELEGLAKDGLLSRLDTAFSRDQVEKIYVQHRMLEHAAQLYAWLEEGAHFYVCGDASRMAKDVDAALHRVIETAGGKTAEQAADYVNVLKAAKRYARDVY